MATRTHLLCCHRFFFWSSRHLARDKLYDSYLYYFTRSSRCCRVVRIRDAAHVWNRQVHFPGFLLHCAPCHTRLSLSAVNKIFVFFFLFVFPIRVQPEKNLNMYVCMISLTYIHFRRRTRSPIFSCLKRKIRITFGVVVVLERGFAESDEWCSLSPCWLVWQISSKVCQWWNDSFGIDRIMKHYSSQ